MDKTDPKHAEHGHHHHTDAAKKDGKVAQDTVISHAEDAIARAKAGELVFTSVGQLDTPVDSQTELLAAASKLTATQKLFWFVADTDVKANA